MTNLPSFPHSLTRGAALAAPARSANAPTRSAKAEGLLIVAKNITLSLGCRSGGDRIAGSSPDLRVPGCVALCLTTQSLAATDERLKNRGEHDDRAGREQLQRCVDVVELKDVGERAEHHRARDRADHRAGAAEEARAADDDRGDRRQFVAGAVVRAAKIELAGVNNAGDRRDQPGDPVNRDF